MGFSLEFTTLTGKEITHHRDNTGGAIAKESIVRRMKIRFVESYHVLLLLLALSLYSNKKKIKSHAATETIYYC